MSSSLRFEQPHIGLQDSYRGLIQELDAGEPLIPFPLQYPHADFPAFLARLAACSRGEDLPPGFVPHTTYWLVADNQVVGVSNLRHALTDSLRKEGGHIGYGIRPTARRQGHAKELLRQTLLQAQSLGIPRALLTCSKSNLGSVRTIINNGGVRDSEEFIHERGETVQRYWIALNK